MFAISWQQQDAKAYALNAFKAVYQLDKDVAEGNNLQILMMSG